ncbi:MAG: FeoB-associated Cys-rich membrane protein [Oscillospiraceae bacterium]|nr:FeoB-associated Cys-rich membrane protein [Oscillospiraceae bacterium]
MVWLMDNLGSIVVGLVLAVILFFAFRSVIRQRKNGGCNCGMSGCDCGCCGGRTPKNIGKSN